MGVAVERPIDLVLAMPKQLERRLATTGTASFALIIALAWFDVRRVVRPLKRLTEAAERIATGLLDEPLQVDRGDELGVLARAFETMRLQLRAAGGCNCRSATRSASGLPNRLDRTRGCPPATPAAALRMPSARCPTHGRSASPGARTAPRASSGPTARVK